VLDLTISPGAKSAAATVPAAGFQPDGTQPVAGNLKGKLRIKRIIPNAMPKYMKVVDNPTDGIRRLATLP